MLKVKLINENARIPTRNTSLDAGADVYSCENVVIPARNRAMVDTGISISIPNETYARVAPRSGLAAKHGIDVFAGVVDSSYRGVVKVILYNSTDVDYEVKIGDKIAQIIIEKIMIPEIIQVDELDSSDRGENGFGSSG